MAIDTVEMWEMLSAAHERDDFGFSHFALLSKLIYAVGDLAAIVDRLEPAESRDEAAAPDDWLAECEREWAEAFSAPHLITMMHNWAGKWQSRLIAAAKEAGVLRAKLGAPIDPRTVIEASEYERVCEERDAAEKALRDVVTVYAPWTERPENCPRERWYETIVQDYERDQDNWGGSRKNLEADRDALRAQVAALTEELGKDARSYEAIVSSQENGIKLLQGEVKRLRTQVAALTTERDEALEKAVFLKRDIDRVRAAIDRDWHVA